MGKDSIPPFYVWKRDLNSRTNTRYPRSRYYSEYGRFCERERKRMGNGQQ